MPNDRLTKKVTLGWYHPAVTVPGKKGKKQNTIAYWRKLLKDAGKDPTDVDLLASDRRKWKDFIRQHMED